MTYADPIQRRELISGLRALADFLENNHGVPAPLGATVYVFLARTSDTEKRKEIDRIAAFIGSPVIATSPHYVTSRFFGAVEYRAVGIPAGEIKEP